MATSSGGNMAGVTMPSEVRKEPKPIPILSACISRPTAVRFTAPEMTASAPTSFIRKIMNMVNTTAIEIPKDLTKPVP